MSLDISDLPPPPGAKAKPKQLLDVSDLPPPPGAQPLDLSDLPPPPGRPIQSNMSGSAAPAEDGILTKLGKGVVGGITSALDPSGKFGLQAADHYTKDRSGWETAAEVVSNFATGRAAAAGAGALVGSFVPIPIVGTVGGALVGNLLYGLYAGVGQEASRSKAEGQEFSPLRAAVNVGLEANPLFRSGDKVVQALRMGSKLWTGARVAGQVAGQTGVEYSYSKDMGSAAVAGGLSLLLSVPLYRSMRSAPTTPDTAAAVVRALNTEVGSDILQRTEAKLAKAAKDIDTEDLEFQRFVTGATGASADTVRERFATLGGKLTPERLQDQWTLHQWSKALQESAGEVVHDLTAKLGGKIDAADLRLRDLAAIKDAKFVGSAIDRKTGLNVEGLFDSFAKAKEAFEVKAVGHMTGAAQVDRAARKAGLSRTDVGKALGGRLHELSPDKQAKLTALSLKDRDGGGKISILDAWRREYDEVYEALRAAGYDVGYIANYVPLKALKGADMAAALRARLGDLQRKALGQKKNSLLDLGDDPEFLEFKDVVGHLVGKDPSKLTEGDLVGAAKSALGRGKTSIGYTPGAVFERTGDGVPEFAREWDVGKLFTQLVNGNLKAVHFDRAFKQGQATHAALERMGLQKSAQYVERYLLDQSGAASRGLAGFIRNTGETLRDAGRQLQAYDGVKGQAGKALEAVPDFVGWANGLVYPSYLGFPNVKAITRNMTQTLFTTVPELGGFKAAKWWGEATGGMIKEAMQEIANKRSPFKLWSKQLQDVGLLGEHIMADIDTTPGLTTGLRYYADKFNSWAMKLYSETDTINRMLAYRMGQSWAKAVANGHPGAVEALAKLGPGTKNQLRASGLIDATIKSKDSAKLGHVLGDWLIGRTQFRYGKEQQSEFGRYMGTAFSMFTKWPVMVGSDIHDSFQRGALNGVRHTAQKYLAPYALLYGAQAAMTASGNDPSVAYKLVVGDAREYSPLESILHPGKQLEQLGGPGVQLAKEGLETLTHLERGDTDKAAALARTAARQLIKGYVPGVSQVINEVDRYERAVDPDAETLSRRFVNDLPVIGQ